MLYVRGVLAVVAVAVMTCQGTLSAPRARTSDAAGEEWCRPRFHDACSDAMGRWLPRFGYATTWWDSATRIGKRDGFVKGPDYGTYFIYGKAGARGRAVYDRVHRIAFFQQGCCAWGEVVAAANASAPPKSIVGRNLLDLSTVRGIRLWQTEADVVKIYGGSAPVPVAGNPGVSVLAYTTLPPRRSANHVHTSCGEFDNFFFRAHRLIQIQLYNGC